MNCTRILVINDQHYDADNYPQNIDNMWDMRFKLKKVTIYIIKG